MNDKFVELKFKGELMNKYLLNFYFWVSLFVYFRSNLILYTG